MLLTDKGGGIDGDDAGGALADGEIIHQLFLCGPVPGFYAGDNATTYPATMDEDSGEYSFGKAFVASGNMVIKVGPTESSVAF